MDDKSILSIWKETNENVKYLLFGTFINQFGFFIQAYLIVFMIHQGFSSDAAGLGLTLLCGSSILGAIAGSNFGVSFGNRNNIILASLGLAVSVVLIPIFVNPNYPSYLWVSIIFICGFFSQMYRPSASVMLSNYLPTEFHVIGFSMFRISLNIGAAIGPIVATFLVALDWKYVFWLNGLTAFSFALIAVFLLKENTKADPIDKNANIQGSWSVVLKDIKYWYFLLAMFISSMVYIQFYSSVPVAIEKNGFPLEVYSMLLVSSSITLILCELKISSIIRNLPAWKPALCGTFFLCLGVSTFGFTLNFGNIIIISSLIVVGGLMISGPTMFAYPASFPLSSRGQYIAANQVSFTMGNALGPILGLKLLAWNTNAVWVFCFLSAIVCSILIYMGMKPVGSEAISNPKRIESNE